ncbi:hypothetical protein LMIV_0281 [Listeria monocytogenes FSL J1-208]|nr:hypothetical protein LMIV_0281 [Listeria monocytogenes FSL J1-208]
MLKSSYKQNILIQECYQLGHNLDKWRIGFLGEFSIYLGFYFAKN